MSSNANEEALRAELEKIHLALCIYDAAAEREFLKSGIRTSGHTLTSMRDRAAAIECELAQPEKGGPIDESQ
ncbi:hypothetical protein NGM99_21315 [Mesorhizobium sp. RP14(2022)]|uniref:Uncharacterized protein n=1 Tax=Mesorhizobium liriopis TaxID=2953882 RepID=A0ABT1CC85_9HYPH|nr:hypothetical protein [Mesorhizobium liriopis]MCO6052333.1 hypothetical protein [Mesorhizobium liriopis]